MARLNIFILMIVLFSSVAFANLPMVEINSPYAIPLLSGYNIWTGYNEFRNITLINYTSFNVTGNVTAEKVISPVFMFNETWGIMKNGTTEDIIIGYIGDLI